MHLVRSCKQQQRCCKLGGWPREHHRTEGGVSPGNMVRSLVPLCLTTLYQMGMWRASMPGLPGWLRQGGCAAKLVSAGMQPRAHGALTHSRRVHVSRHARTSPPGSMLTMRTRPIGLQEHKHRWQAAAVPDPRCWVRGVISLPPAGRAAQAAAVVLGRISAGCGAERRA